MSEDGDNLEFIELGEIVGVWGIKGWIKIRSHTRQRDDILGYENWFIGRDRQERKLLAGHRQGAGIVAHIEGIDDRDAADGFIGWKIYVPASEIPTPEAGEYYWSQLEGLAVVNMNRAHLGVVDHLFETGANDVMVIDRDAGEMLVPYVPGVVREVNLEEGFIKLDWQSDD